MKTFKNYKDFQNHIVSMYNITLDEHSSCWARTHVHPKERRICKWKPANSFKSTWTLLHEIGHIENNMSGMRRVEQEFFATTWAIDRCLEFGIDIPSATLESYQKYIDRTLDRGKRCGGKGYMQDYSLTEYLKRRRYMINRKEADAV